MSSGFPDRGTGLGSLRATVSPGACPVCGGAFLDRLGIRSDGIEVLQCARCRMGVVAERPFDTSAYYSDAYYAGPEAGESGYSEYSLVAAHSLAWAAEFVHLLSPGGKVLDVGCADGHLLRLLGPCYQPHGIEVNERLFEYCQSTGIRMLGRDICDPRLPEEHGGSFDVITAIAVLEHVADIRTALSRIRELLTPEGVLIFEVPLISDTQDNRVWWSSSLEHVYYPTLEGLAFLFESVFGLPLIGREVVIRDYGSTFVGLATRSPTRHWELTAFLEHLIDAPVSTLSSRRERSFRFFFDLVHAAGSTAETTALLAELPPERVTPELLHRLAALWSLDLSRGGDGGWEREALNRQIAAALNRVELAETRASELRRTLASLASDLGRERSRAEAAEARHAELQKTREELEARLTEQDRVLLALRGEAEQLEAALHAIVSSRSWRLVDRWWKLRTALRPGNGRSGFGVMAWKTARFFYRLLPISGQTRFKLRRTVLAWLSVPDDAPPDVAVARLRDLVQRLTWRRAASAAALLLRGDRAALKMHVNQLVQHSVNQETHQALAGAGGDPVEFTVQQRQEPWPASRPLVSVVIPCYNYGHFVAEAVDSVLAQTFQDFEILVIDGGSSSEDSLAALKALDRPKTRVFFREGRHLVGDNRNFGISRAQGKYVCCLDADDMIKPTYLEKALFLLETQGYDVVSTSIRSFGEKSEVYHLERFPVLADMLQGNHVSTCAVFHRDLWTRAGGYQDAGIGGDYFYEDWRLWVRFAALGARIANIVEEPLFLYRVHSSQSLSCQGQVVPTMDRQREAVIDFNRDVINDEALRLSEENRRLKIRMEDGFVNLKRGVPASPASQGTILIAMPFLVIGGAERLMSEVAAHLSGQGFRIVVVTTEYVYPVYGDSTPWFERATAEIYHLPRFLEASRWQEFIRYLLETRDASLLWIVGSRVFYDLLPSIKSAHPGLKVIDLLFNTVGHTGSNRKYAAFFDKILVENREVANWLVEAGEQPERVLQVPSGVDLQAFRPFGKSERILGDLGIAPDSFIAGFSGRLSEEKDPEAFLKIARACRGDSRLVFLMTGAGPLSEQVEQRIEKMALGDSLRFLGQVEHVREYMATYDVLILPSRFDGRPVAVLESLALGVPVIASRVGALPELIQDGVTGFLCEPGDVRAFAERVRWLAAHPEEHRRMKAAARAFAESALDARQMFERYEAAVRGVLESGSPEKEPRQPLGGDLDPQPGHAAQP